MLDLNIILPVHNEVNSVGKVLQEWKDEVDKLKISYEFIVCEDGSIDGTKDLLLKLQDSFPMRLSYKETRRGYGKAVVDGIKIANSNFVLCIDSDGQCDPSDFSEFWRNKDIVDVLIGWRTNRQDTFLRKVYSGSFKIIFKLLFSSSLHDPSAPFVLFRKQQIINNLKYLLFLKEGFWWGFVAMCYKKNVRIDEIPINHRPRIDGETRVFVFSRIFKIALRNIVGLVKLKFAR
jgi:glycosyltransferase involved in cell wall biosynthesis